MALSWETTQRVLSLNKGKDVAAATSAGAACVVKGSSAHPSSEAQVHMQSTRPCAAPESPQAVPS